MHGPGARAPHCPLSAVGWIRGHVVSTRAATTQASGALARGTPAARLEAARGTRVCALPPVVARAPARAAPHVGDVAWIQQMAILRCACKGDQGAKAYSKQPPRASRAARVLARVGLQTLVTCDFFSSDLRLAGHFPDIRRRIPGLC